LSTGNHQRYHESLDNVRPAAAYWGRQEQILAERKKIKQLTLSQRRKSGPPQWSYFSARPKCLKPSLLFSPTYVHFWLTTYTTNPQEAFSLSLFIRNNQFNGFNTRTYVKDLAAHILFTGEYNSETNLILEADMPLFQVTVIREAGPDAIGNDALDYAEDHLRIQALTEQEAHLMADFICCLPFNGQVRRTYIQHIEHFDERH
jgi:hypothetical protein